MRDLSCQRQRAVHINLNAGGFFQQSGRDKIISELFTCFHRTDRVRTRRTNTNFEDVKYTDHIARPYVKAWINSVVKIHEAVTFQFRLIIVVAVARRRGQQSFIY